MLQHFDRVFWFTSGSDERKPNMLEGIHRQILSFLAFDLESMYAPKPGWAPFSLDASAAMTKDIPTAIRFSQLEEQFPGADITCVNGSDWITPKDGRLPIESWDFYDTTLCKKKLQFIPRAGFLQPGEMELPPHMSWFPCQPLPDISSTMIREMIAAGDQRWRQLVNRRVEQYIDFKGLYLPSH